MKDPTARSEWVLSYCTDCHRNVNFWRVEKHRFRCADCGLEKEIPEADHDRDGMLED